MNCSKVLIADYDIVCAYGKGINSFWKGLNSKKSAINKCTRFNTDFFKCDNAATIDSLQTNVKQSLVMQMINQLFSSEKKKIFTKNSFLISATTVGEIDLLEKEIFNNNENFQKSVLSCLGTKIQKVLKLNRPGIVISSACASSLSAIARASSLINNGKESCVVVVAADAVSEFVFSGFSSLMALDNNFAKPFDKNRDGLTVGEAAAYVVLVSEDFAEKNRIKNFGKIIGSAQSNDANHITSPSRNGDGLANAIQKTLEIADLHENKVGFIAAHGTGTKYNDATELKAFKKIFSKSLPIFSVKGAIGHTMGSSGVVQLIAALESFKKNVLPPTIGLKNVDDDAKGWAADIPQKFDGKIALITNAGFGGINAATLLKRS